MTTEPLVIEPERYEFLEPPRYRFSLSRRAFVQSVGAGLFVTSLTNVGFAQEGSESAKAPTGRFHIDKDGVVTAFTGKVDVGQGSRTQLSQAVAEELRVPLSQVRLVMGDTALVPNDGGTYGSQTTPRTVPAVRQAAASARELLVELACEQWKVKPDGATMSDGIIRHKKGQQITLAELVAKVSDIDRALTEKSTEEATLTSPDAWQVLGKSVLKVNGADIVTGKHKYPSDIKRPRMLYGKVLRPPSYGAELIDIDLKPAQALEGVTVVRDGAFVGCTAPTSFQASRALAALEGAAKWNVKPHPSSSELYQLLKDKATPSSGRQRSRDETEGDVETAMKDAAKVIRGSYQVPYIQHAPMEPRAAVAEWEGDNKLTVWTGTQRPFDVRNDVAEAFHISAENVRLIVPDTGGGFGGKHSADVALEAARLAKDAKAPVAVHWTREEEFTWAYFRPAGVLEVAAAIDTSGSVTGWDFTNYNSGSAGIGCPYTIPNTRIRFQSCDAPLRGGSYRALAATANNFAREAFIDLLAKETGTDPVAFRLSYLKEQRLKDVLSAAAKQFDWEQARQSAAPGVGVGIACGTEKGSFVATCAEILVDAAEKRFSMRRICIAFECGAIQNPTNLKSQIEGCVIMGLGGALSEEIRFQDGKVLNNRFSKYKVPRFKDTPPIDIVLVNRPDLPSVGAGEMPIITIAPAIANAIFRASGKPTYSLPLTFSS